MNEFAKGPARPFLKWAGGKTQIINQIWENLPSKFNDYYEPFLGGGSVFFLICNNHTRIPMSRSLGKRRFFLSDKNHELISTYEAVRDDVHALLSELSSFQRLVNKTDYYRIRKQEPKNKIKRAARFIFLNKTCYNGLYRVNREGKFNVPWNGVERAHIYNPRDLKEASRSLQETEIVCCDFESAFVSPAEGDLVYADPPYYTEGFRNYTTDGFDKTDHKRLASQLNRLTNEGCYILHSNSNAQLIHDLYPNPSFWRSIIKSRRMINRNAKGRTPIPELLIRNYTVSKTIGYQFSQEHLLE